MKTDRYVTKSIERLSLVAGVLILTALSVMAQDIPAPNISGMAVQGMTVNLNYFRGDKNVLVVFYRMHN